MQLILLRHGKAEDFHKDGDAARRLVEKGERQAARAGRLMLALDQRPDVVLTSPRVRCTQTAELFCDAAEMPGPVTQPWLNCGMSPDDAMAELAAFLDFERVMLVGHEPDFSTLVESLLRVSGGAVEVKKGSLVVIEIHPPARHARLLAAVPPKMMASKRLAVNHKQT